MVRTTVRQVGQRLEKLTERQIPLNRSFEVLERKAKTLEEMVVIEVMREVYLEIGLTENRIAS